MGLTPPPVPTPTPHNGGDFTPQHAKQGAPPPLTKLAWEGPQMQSSSPPLPITPSIPGKGVSSPQVWGGAWKRGGGGLLYAACCVTAPPPPRACHHLPGFAHPEHPGVGRWVPGVGGAVVHTGKLLGIGKTLLGWCPPLHSQFVPFSLGWGGGRRAVSPAGSSGVGGTADQWSTSSPWSGWVLCPPPPPPPLGQTPRQPGEHQPVGVTIFFWGGMTGDGGTGPGCIQPPQGGGPAELGVTPTSIGGGCIEPPHRQRGHCPHPGDLRCRAPAMAIPCWEQRMVGRGWSGGGKEPKNTRCCPVSGPPTPGLGGSWAQLSLRDAGEVTAPLTPPACPSLSSCPPPGYPPPPK